MVEDYMRTRSVQIELPNGEKYRVLVTDDVYEELTKGMVMDFSIREPVIEKPLVICPESQE